VARSTRTGLLVPEAAPAVARLCPGDRTKAPSPGEELKWETLQVVMALNRLPAADPALSCPTTRSPRVVDLVLVYPPPTGRIVVALNTAGCGLAYRDGQFRFGAGQVVDLLRRLVESRPGTT
jgi:hypothetical protein